MEKSNSNRIPSLDGLRALSILMVILDHQLSMPHIPHAIHGFGMYGRTGVDVFFVISGFLITTLLLKEREKTGTISLRRFYVRRAYRILPASFTVIFLIGIVWHNRVTLRDVLCSIFYVQNFNPKFSWSLSHMWSLSVEEQFYLLWPFLLSRFFRHRYKIVIATLILAPLSRGACAMLGLHEQALFWFPCVMDALAIGCLWALCKEKAEVWSKVTDKWILLIAAATLAIPQFHYPRGVMLVFMLSLEHVGIVVCAEHCIRKKYWILNWSPVVWIGVLSYSIYLCQMPFFQRESPNMFERFPLNLVCILLAAIACHYMVEKPFLRLREQRAKRLKSVQISG